MADRFRIHAPLEVDGWEIIDALEEYTLFDEFADRIETATGLLYEGQSLWREHLKGGEWSSEAGQTIVEVRRLACNIHQRFGGSTSDLATCIRWAVGAASTVTDSQCVAALAMDRVCWAVETLAGWLADFDSGLYGVSEADTRALADESPMAFGELVETLRGEFVGTEVHVRERVADLLGTARHYMTLAEIYATPLLSTEARTALVQTIMAKELPTALQEEKRQRASRGGKKGSKTKMEEAAKNAKTMCDVARQIRSQNPDITNADLVKQLADRGSGASEPTVRAYLRTEGLYPPPRQPKKTF